MMRSWLHAKALTLRANVSAQARARARPRACARLRSRVRAGVGTCRLARARHASMRACVRVWPISVVRFWISEGLTQALS